MEIVWPANKTVFMFRCITLKHLNSLTNIDSVSWLGDLEVTHRTAMPQVPGSIPSSEKDIYVCFFVWLLHINCFGHITRFVIKQWHSCCYVMFRLTNECL